MSKTTNKYSPEVRERAGRMVLDNPGQHESRWSAIVSVSSKIGCSAQTLNEWVKKAEVDSGNRPSFMPLIGYARVSTEDQTPLPQSEALQSAGCAEIFEEHASGGNRARPVLARVLERIGKGDTLVVVRIDRLARSLSHLLEVIERLEGKGAFFRSLQDPIDTASPQGKFTLQVLGAAAEFERALIRERTKAGLASARSKGRVGGNPG
ncbi:MAG: recombinase family protein, partial [Pseudomonadota bacterium]|nr:recombinase family protein [Pseudomonadota bacterium]